MLTRLVAWVFALATLAPSSTSLAVDVSLRPARAIGGTVLPRLDIRPQTAAGEIELEVMLDVPSVGGGLHNPCLDPKSVLPARVMVFDERETYLGDLLVGLPDASEVRGEPNQAWLYAGMSVGRRLKIPCGTKTRTAPIEGLADAAVVESLGQGVYYLQSVYTDALWDKCRREGARLATGKEIGRSKALKIALPLAEAKPRNCVDVDGVQIEASIAETVLKHGEGVDLTFSVVNTSAETVDVFNPLLSSLFRAMPLRIEVRDADGVAIQNLLEPTDGSRRRLSEDAWFQLPPEGMVGIRKGPIGVRGQFTARDLPNGDYHLEVIVLDRLLSPCPVRPLAKITYPEWREKYRGEEIGRLRPIAVSVGGEP
jgi:hypothetical protein